MESFVEGTKKKRERKRETRCLSGVLSMHSAEKLNLNRGGRTRPWGHARSAREHSRGCGTCHDWLDVIGEIDWPRLTSWINIGEKKGRPIAASGCVVSTCALQRLDSRGVLNARGAVKWPRCIMECFRPIGDWMKRNSLSPSILSIVSRVNFFFLCFFLSRSWKWTCGTKLYPREFDTSVLFCYPFSYRYCDEIRLESIFDRDRNYRSTHLFVSY